MGFTLKSLPTRPSDIAARTLPWRLDLRRATIMPRYFFHLSAPDACCRDPRGCGVSDLLVTRPGVRVSAAAQHARSRMSLSRVICRGSLTASLLFVGSAAFGDTRALMLHHVHTNEKLTITYKENGQYDKAA